MQSTDPKIFALSEDILVQVLSKLDAPRDLASASAACKQLNRAVHTDKIWRDLYARQFLSPSARAGLKLSQWANNAAPCRFSPEEALFRWKWQTNERWARGARTTLGALHGHSAWVNAVRCVPNASRVISAGQDEDIIIWGEEQASLWAGLDDDHTPRATLKGHTATVWSVDASDALAVSGGMDTSILLWDLVEGKMAGEMHLQEEGRARTVTSVQLGHAATTCLTTHAGGSIALWDNRSHELASHLHLLASSGGLPDGEGPQVWPESKTAAYCARVHEHHVVAVGNTTDIHYFDLRMARQVCRVVAAKKSIFSMDLQWPMIATGCANGEVRVWDMDRLHIPASAPSSPASSTPGPFAASGAQFSKAYSERLDNAQRCCRAFSTPEDSQIFSIRLSPDGRLVSASEGGVVGVYNVADAPGSSGSSKAGGSWQGFGSDGHLMGSPRRISPVQRFTPALDSDPTLCNELPYPPFMQKSGVHSVDMSDDLLVCGGRDALVRLYSFAP
ncbi:hypothetical protein WJX74_007775 [Apatococcus lobatus]|uniref:F-box domain-containing protein n=1 Tax=Apatococcus lobatus TaxID=904363 RepID=A0AAW1QKQ8_9CHLO